MNFALLGADEESLALAAAAVVQGHRIIWCGDVGWAVENFDLPWLSHDHADDWEVLLDSQFCDAVLVGRGEAPAERRLEQVMPLVRNGITLLTTFPLHESVLTYYVLDMAREESKALLRHFNPFAGPSVIAAECEEWTQNGHPQLGPVEQITWERPLAERNRENVLWHFARDVEVLSHLAGRLNRLGALGSPNEAATYAGLSVQMLGPRNVPVRWSVEPAAQTEAPRLTLIAQQGKETFEIEPADPAASAISRLVAEIGAGRESTWPAALNAMELADTIEISLRRGRMIDVHSQQLTEDLAFKGTMSALGCGVLMVLPPVLLLLGWLADLVGLPVARFWPHILLALLAAFLGVQVLSKLLIRKP